MLVFARVVRTDVQAGALLLCPTNRGYSHGHDGLKDSVSDWIVAQVTMSRAVSTEVERFLRICSHPGRGLGDGRVPQLSCRVASLDEWPSIAITA